MTNRHQLPVSPPSSAISTVLLRAALPSVLGGTTIAALVAGAPLGMSIFLCATTALVSTGLLYRAGNRIDKPIDTLPAEPGQSSIAEFPPIADIALTEEGSLHLERNAAVDRLIAIVAEDIDRHRKTVTTSLQNLERHLAGQPLIAHQLQPIRMVLERTAAFKTRLLAFSDQATWMPERISTAKLIERAAGLLCEAVLSDATPLKCTTPNDLWPIDADPDQMLIAVLHLAANARDAMPRGGTIAISGRNVTLAGAPADLTGDYVAITVTDGGTGIPSAHLEEIFLPFFTTKAQHSGEGLGLGQVKTAALRAGGDVTITSTIGIGTEVTLYLPRAEAAAEMVPIDEADARAKRPDILIAKGDEAEAAELARLATAVGYQVTMTTRAIEACAIIREQHPRLVITDTAMHGIVENISLGRYLRHAHPKQQVVLTATAFRISEVESFPILPEPPTHDALAAFLGEAPAHAARRRLETQEPTAA